MYVILFEKYLYKDTSNLINEYAYFVIIKIE